MLKISSQYLEQLQIYCHLTEKFWQLPAYSCTKQANLYGSRRATASIFSSYVWAKLTKRFQSLVNQWVSSTLQYAKTLNSSSDHIPDQTNTRKLPQSSRKAKHELHWFFLYTCKTVQHVTKDFEGNYRSKNFQICNQNMDLGENSIILVT